MDASSLPPAPPRVALSVAGSDCSGGAGIQADLQTFQAHGVYGLTAVTCVVAEVPGIVAGIQAVDPAIVAQQLTLCLRAFPVAAMKTGLLHTRAVIEAVAEVLESIPRDARPTLVVDPVMIASSGDALLQPEALAALKARILPLATLVTPNLDEARVMLGGRAINDQAALLSAARELCERYGVGFLVKGGHLAGDEAVDVLCLPAGHCEEFRTPLLRNRGTHGTGCTYSAAITANLATGQPMNESIARAKRFVTRAIATSFTWEGTGGPVAALARFQAPES